MPFASKVRSQDALAWQTESEESYQNGIPFDSPSSSTTESAEPAMADVFMGLEGVGSGIVTDGPATAFRIMSGGVSQASLLWPGNKFFSFGASGAVVSASREYLLQSNEPFEVVKIRWSDRSTTRPGDITFAIERPIFRTELSGFSRHPNIRGVSYSPRFVNRSTIDSLELYPWDSIDGISITSFPVGSDLIYPYGIGERDSGNTTITERGTTYVNSGSGYDVVVGGYGQDYFGARTESDLRSLFSVKSAPSSVSTGSKLFVGGSSNDLLDGGRDDDFLVGDRLNGYELYLPSKALSGLDTRWNSLIDRIKTYQPKGFSDTSGAGHEILANKDRQFGSSSYPLWIPGNDVIRGYEGDDVIHGDDNAIDANLYQLPVIRKWLNETPSAVVRAGGINGENWKTIRLGADFIDGGDGSDQIYAGLGADAIIGGGGSDVIDMGSQIVAKEYEPFFGPKFVFGDNASYDPITGQWRSSGERSPDVFVLGTLYNQEEQLRNKNSGQLDQLSEQRRTIAEELKGFEKVWEVAGKVVGLIPKAGSIINGLVGVTTKLLKLKDPSPVAVGKPAKAADALTVIKDFDPTDQLSITLAKGETLKFRYNTYGSNFDNDLPFAPGTSGTPGMLFEYSNEAGSAYDRVFLENVDKLFILGITEVNGAEIWTLGGSDYGSILNDATGAPAYRSVQYS